MKKKILINAIYPEEKRVAIVEGDTLSDFYVETVGKEHLRGNIYKGVIARVEPGLQAAFVDFGPKKHGFLQMREIQPEYFKNKGGGKRARMQDVLRKGLELIVQVVKDERDTKGASLTTYISIPGRYIVMMPGQDRVGISRKIEDKEDRDKMKDIFNSLKLPKGMGFILRTAGSDKTSEDLSNDLKYLTKLWHKIQTEANKVSGPSLIYKEQDIAVRTVRDYLTDDVDEVLIDDQEAYRNTKQFLIKTLPWRKINIRFYKDKKPIFLKHNIEEQIARLNERHVHLPSKGYIVIDKTEALTAIDVNSGRSRKEANIEATAFKTNLEAADEVARQFRLRDIGGLIVIDFIDMEAASHRKEVEKRLKDALVLDKAHTEVTGISKFGMVEMTRERMRTAYFESINRNCDSCKGAGTIMTNEMSAITAFREMHTRAAKGGIKNITCKLSVEGMNYLLDSKREDIALIEQDFNVSIKLVVDIKIFPGQYDLTVEKNEADGESFSKPENHGLHKVEHAHTGHHVVPKAEVVTEPVNGQNDEQEFTQEIEREPETEIEQFLEPMAEQPVEQKTEIKKPHILPRSRVVWRSGRRPRIHHSEVKSRETVQETLANINEVATEEIKDIEIKVE